MNFDLINGLWEFGGAVVIAISAFKCWCNKSADGVHWVMTAYFLGWGLWNLPYYMSLEQTWSLKAAALTAFMNIIYTGLLIKYSFFKKPVDSEIVLP